MSIYVVLLLSVVQCCAMESKKTSIEELCQQYCSLILAQAVHDFFKENVVVTTVPDNDKKNSCLIYVDGIGRSIGIRRNEASVVIIESFNQQRMRALDFCGVRKKLVDYHKAVLSPDKKWIQVNTVYKGGLLASNIPCPSIWHFENGNIVFFAGWDKGVEKVVEVRDTFCKNIYLMQINKFPGGKNNKMLLPLGYSEKLSYFNKLLGDQQEHKKS